MTDSGAAVSVDFRVALTFDIGEWESAFVYAMERVRQEAGDAIQLMDPESPRVDILVVVYQGTDHDAIITRRVLEQLLSGYGRPVGRLCVYACGRTRGRGALREANVRKLLHDQLVGFAGVPIAGRVLQPDAFGDSLREEIMMEIRRRKLLAPPRPEGIDINQRIDDEVSRDEWSL